MEIEVSICEMDVRLFTQVVDFLAQLPSTILRVDLLSLAKVRALQFVTYGTLLANYGSDKWATRKSHPNTILSKCGRSRWRF